MNFSEPDPCTVPNWEVSCHIKSFGWIAKNDSLCDTKICKLVCSWIMKLLILSSVAVDASQMLIGFIEICKNVQNNGGTLGI